ncbi:MAG: UbiD family decarboxylase [Anaerolineae bacterium]|jgi:2,5-furandicarboxylate decarboxylase 1
MSEIYDLRSFLDRLEGAGQLVRIGRPVDLKYELADVAAALERRRRPAPLFESVCGSDWPIFASAIANQTRAALALGCERSKVVAVMHHALDPANGIPPVRVDDAAWKANVVTGDQVDVQKLPIPTHAVGDGGPFITGGVVVSKDPVSGRGNLSYNRMQVKGPRLFGFNLNEWRHVREFMDVQEAKGEPLQVAVAIGLDPAIMIAGGARYPDDELFIAGAIRGRGIRVSRGVTVDVDIPADAEIVIEGYLGAHEREAEGPLAEFHGYFGELWESPVFHVTAVGWRDDPIFQTLIPGWNEHLYLGNVLPREPVLLNHVGYVSRNVTGVHIPPYASGFTAIVSVDKSNPGEPKNLALAAFTAHVNIKWCIVVDPDVDMYDPADVMWALTTRVDWSKDVFLVPGAQGHEMDPTADARGVHTKIGVDATAKKERRGYEERVRYSAVDLGQYLPGG